MSVSYAVTLRRSLQTPGSSWSDQRHRIAWETEMEARSHESIQRDPDYQDLVRRRSSLGWTLSLIMLVIYFGFILLVAYAPKFLGTRLGTGVTTIGIPIGLFVIASAFVLTGIYVSKANSKYDRLIRRIVEG